MKNRAVHVLGAAAVIGAIALGVVVAAEGDVAAAVPRTAGTAMGNSTQTAPLANPSATPVTWASPPTTALNTAPATSATTPTIAPRVPAPPTPTIAERGAEALRRLSYPYESLGYTIVFLPPMGGYYGRGFHEQKRIEVYVRPDQSADMLAHVVAHEIGHAVDFVFHTPERDRLWLTLRGKDVNTEWAPCAFCSDFGAPSGDFAEVFAFSQIGREFHSTFAPRPTPEQLRQLEVLFRA